MRLANNQPAVRGLVLTLLLLIASSSSAAPPATKSAKLAIIIDDVGYNQRLGQRAAMLPGQYTLAILPLTPYSRPLAKLAAQRGKTLMLHTPMASIHKLALGPGGLTPDMNRAQITASLERSIAAVPGISGMNNHMGSELTTHADIMGWVMDLARRHHLFFIDSRTIANSKALEVARRYGVASAERNVFLDDIRKVGDIRTQLQKAITHARQYGRAIAIGHPYPETLSVLEQAGPLLAREHIQLVPASALVRLPPPTRGACPAPPAMLQNHPFAAPKPTAHKWRVKL